MLESKKALDEAAQHVAAMMARRSQIAAKADAARAANARFKLATARAILNDEALPNEPPLELQRDVSSYADVLDVIDAEIERLKRDEDIARGRYRAECASVALGLRDDAARAVEQAADQLVAAYARALAFDNLCAAVADQPALAKASSFTLPFLTRRQQRENAGRTCYAATVALKLPDVRGEVLAAIDAMALPWETR